MTIFYPILIIIAFSLVDAQIAQFNTTANGFPKVIWSYWEQGIDSSPFFTKLCIKNRDKIAEASGWNHVVLSKSTFNEYISAEEVEKYLAMSLTRHIQLKADLIRSLLLMKHGGLWIDINSYLLKDLSWVENPNQRFISNQLGESPDIILAAFTEGLSGGSATLRAHKSGKTVNIFPIYENWMILAKPNNQFLQDCLNIYV